MSQYNVIKWNFCLLVNILRVCLASVSPSEASPHRVKWAGSVRGGHAEEQAVRAASGASPGDVFRKTVT